MKLAALGSALLFSVVCFAASPTLGETFNTENSSSDMHLENGVSVHLAARSTGTIFADHAVLDQGAANVTNFAGYKVQAGPLQLESETPGTRAAIRVQPNKIEIASLGGDVKVLDNVGALLTRVSSGTRVSFQNSGATPAQSGATPGPKPKSEFKTWVWVIVGVSAAALAIGLTAAAEGKSPF